MLQNGKLPQPETAFERVIYEYTLSPRKILFEKNTPPSSQASSQECSNEAFLTSAPLC